MSERGALPRRLDYRRAAFDQAAYGGEIALSALPRTRAVCVADSCGDDKVSVAIGFKEDGQRRVIVEGQASVTLALACQRCLEATPVAVDTAIRGMAVANDEAAADVPRDWEPMLADGQLLDLYSLVDDELLLALPITVVCDRADCEHAFSRDKEQGEAVHDSAAASQDKTNPFAALAALKASDGDKTN